MIERPARTDQSARISSAATRLRALLMILRAGLLWLMLAGAAHAQLLQFPGNATMTREDISLLDSYVMPTGIWDAGGIPTRTVEGRVVRQAWEIAAPALTTLQVLRPLREQLRNDRFDVIFECQTEACGGFDFRFAIETFPPPEMRINIGDFRFLTAERRGPEGPVYVSLFVSRTAQAGFVEVTYVTPAATQADIAMSEANAAPLRAFGAAPDAPLAAQLADFGRSVLADLTFSTGSAQLDPGVYASLGALAAYLLDNPDRTVALVGHTDAAGPLDVNIALSKRRAASVRERLVTDYGVPRSQLAAEGVGYLAPIASNRTAAGRQANRRVEVIITSPP